MSSSSPSPSCSPQADRAGDSWRSTAARRRTPRHDASVPLPPAPSPAFGSPRARSVLAANATLTTPWRPGREGTRPTRKGGRKLAGADRGALRRAAIRPQPPSLPSGCASSTLLKGVSAAAEQPLSRAQGRARGVVRPRAGPRLGRTRRPLARPARSPPDRSSPQAGAWPHGEVRHFALDGYSPKYFKAI